MSEANGVVTTKQVIISLVIVGVLVATADQIGRNFLLANITARLDSVEARLDSFESNITARLGSFESNITARLDSFESSIIARLDSFEKNIEARLVRAEKGEAPAPDLELR